MTKPTTEAGHAHVPGAGRDKWDRAVCIICRRKIISGAKRPWVLA